MKLSEAHGDRLFEAVCKLALEGIVSKKLDAKSVRSVENLAQVKNPKAKPAALLFSIETAR